MRELKTLFLGALALTFIGGVGLGAWVGSLRAAPPAAPKPVDRRVEDWQAHFDLTRSQVRRLREALSRYDHEVKRIRESMNAEQWQRVQIVTDETRTRLREILTEEQRADFDKLRQGRD